MKNRVEAPSDTVIARFGQFRYALRALAAANEAISRSHGLTAQQFQAMLAMCDRTEPMALKDLADQLFLKHSAAVQLFLRMERTGYVQRERSAADRRIVLVKLTEAGLEVTKRVAGQQIELLEQRSSELMHVMRGFTKAQTEQGKASDAAI